MSIYNVISKVFNNPDGMTDIWSDGGFVHDKYCMLGMNARNHAPGEKGIMKCRSCNLLSRVVMEGTSNQPGIAYFDPEWTGQVWDRSFIIEHGDNAGRSAIIHNYLYGGKLNPLPANGDGIRIIECDDIASRILLQLVFQELISDIPRTMGVFSCQNRTFTIDETVLDIDSCTFTKTDAISAIKQLVYILDKVGSHKYTHCNPTVKHLVFTDDLYNNMWKGDGRYILTITHGNSSSITYGKSRIVNSRSRSKIGSLRGQPLRRVKGCEALIINKSGIDDLIALKASGEIDISQSLDYYCFMIGLCRHPVFMEVIEETQILYHTLAIPTDYQKLKVRIQNIQREGYLTFRQTLTVLADIRLRCDGLATAHARLW